MKHCRFLRWKQLRWLAAVTFFGLSTGLVIAYFSARSWLRGQILGVSTASIQIVQQVPELFNPFLPGESQPFVWTITNTGSIPLHLAARFVGQWSQEGLDALAISIANLEYKQANTQFWQSIDLPIVRTGEQFMLGASQNIGSLLELGANETLEVRGELLLDAAVGDEYQSAEFPMEIQVIAKQANQDSQWPVYE